MKRMLILMFIISTVSVLFGLFLFNTYQRNIKELLYQSSSLVDNFYILQAGAYNSIETATDNSSDFKYYVIESDNNLYKVYVGITSNEEIANKIRDIYVKRGKEIYMKEKLIADFEFVSSVVEYDNSIINEESSDKIIDNTKYALDMYRELKKDDSGSY